MQKLTDKDMPGQKYTICVHHPSLRKAISSRILGRKPLANREARALCLFTSAHKEVRFDIRDLVLIKMKMDRDDIHLILAHLVSLWVHRTFH